VVSNLYVIQGNLKVILEVIGSRCAYYLFQSACQWKLYFICKKIFIMLIVSCVFSSAYYTNMLYYFCNSNSANNDDDDDDNDKDNKIITSVKVEVIRSGRFVRHYCKSDEPILLKLDVVIGPTSRKNRLNFGGDPIRIPDHFPLPSLLRNMRF